MPDYREYLEAKFAIDSRSLDRRLLSAFRSRMEQIPSPVIVDLGCGTGAMLRRLLATELRGSPRLYGVDRDSDLLALARSKITELVQGRGFRVETRGATLLGRSDARELAVRLVQGDFLDPRWPELLPGLNAHGVTAHAFMDLMPLSPSLERIAQLLGPGGVFYATLNYDGLTTFLPGYEDPDFEAALLAGYNRSMDERRVQGQPTGGSKSGRRLFQSLVERGFGLQGLGTSDWCLFPGREGYSAGEEVLLESIIRMISGQGFEGGALNADRLHAWQRARLEDVAACRLCLVVHHLDILAVREADD